MLLLHHYLAQNLKLHVIMESPAKDRKPVDIRETVIKNKQIIPDLLAAHAISGCDTVACCFISQMCQIETSIQALERKKVTISILKMLYFQCLAAKKVIVDTYRKKKKRKKGTSSQRSGKGAIRKRLPLQKPGWEKPN